jgi:hypothetical protein
VNQTSTGGGPSVFVGTVNSLEFSRDQEAQNYYVEIMVQLLVGPSENEIVVSQRDLFCGESVVPQNALEHWRQHLSTEGRVLLNCP